MAKEDKYLLVILIIGAIIIYNIPSIISTKDTNSNLSKKIDSIEYKIDSIKNERAKIKTVINSDTTHIRIIHEKYKITVDHIIHESFAADSSYFSNYIENYSRQHNYNNSKTIKDN